jgi:hypothetical protein
LGNDENPCLPKKKNTALHIQSSTGAQVVADMLLGQYKE